MQEGAEKLYHQTPGGCTLVQYACGLRSAGGSIPTHSLPLSSIFWQQIPQYPDVIKFPMDFGTILVRPTAFAVC